MSANDDLFEDDVTEADVATTEGEEANEEVTEAEETEEGDDTEAETPAAEEENDTSKTEKMIPESRLKAALENVTKERDSLKQENSTLKANAPKNETTEQVPNPVTHPEEHAKHVRFVTSRSIMSATHEDYDEVIAHYQEMAKDNPHLNQLVVEHEMPAKFAYDLAKKNMEIQELSNLKDDPEYKEFKEWKKAKGAATPEKKDTSLTLGSNLPKNLNRATSANRVKDSASNTDDELFAGAPY